MGWTSFNYTEAKHLTFNAKKAYQFCKNKFNRNNYSIVRFYLQKAMKLSENNVVYLVLKHPEDYNFIMVVLIDIVDNEIYYKEICASSGPTETKCPVEFLSKVPLPKTESYEYDWFIKVLKNKVKYKNQLV